MILIAHRGNVHGPKPLLENSPKYIDTALAAGYHVEVDLWVSHIGIALGHAGPEHKVDKRWFAEREDSLWIHCKNFEALTFVVDNGFHGFYHQTDAYTLTTRGFIWAYPGEEYEHDKIVSVLPETDGDLDYGYPMESVYYAICSDYVGFMKGLQNV